MFRKYFRSKKQKNAILFGFLLTYSYLCTRFPRNRWQEDRRVACYVALERYNNRLIIYNKNGFN